MKMSLVRRMAQTAAVVLIFVLPVAHAENKSYMDDVKVGSGSTLSYKKFQTDLAPKAAKGIDASETSTNTSATISSRAVMRSSSTVTLRSPPTRSL